MNALFTGAVMLQLEMDLCFTHYCQTVWITLLLQIITDSKYTEE